MQITREAAKVLVTLTPEQVKVLAPRINLKNWKFLVAWAEGKDVRIDGRKWDAFYFDSDSEAYTIVQPTIRIGDMDVPAPETKPVEDGVIYCIADPISKTKYRAQIWGSQAFEIRMLKQGRVHLTAAAAIAHANAEILVAGGKVD